MYGFDQGTNIILKEAEVCLEALQKEYNLIKIMKNLSSYFSKSEKKVFLTGSGINRLISNIIAIRLQNLMINVYPMEDWRFRQEDDLLISISGSGSSTNTLNLMKNAKKSKMNIIGISSFPQSEFAKLLDIFLYIQGREESVNSNGFTSPKAGIYLPIFEYLTVLTLESCVAQMAIDLGILGDLADFRRVNVE
ncbi:MAG: SIS domain-containing protein [Candidatus Hodarchaeota archaeon]